jgi:hypothetical protein
MHRKTRGRQQSLYRSPKIAFVHARFAVSSAIHTEKRRGRVPPAPLTKVRSLCIGFPEATERLSHGEPAFFVNGKLFAMFASAENHHGAGRPAVWIKAAAINQAFVIDAEPDRYFKPPYVGPSGWIGVWLDRRPSWKAVHELLADGYRLSAPKRLLAAIDATTK